MATITKTAAVAVLAHTAITHPNYVIGSAQDVSTKLAATLHLFHSSVEATANTNPGSFYVQVSGKTSGDDSWTTAAQFTASVVTDNTEAVTGTEAAGATVIECASTTGYTAALGIYFKNGTLANSEWGTIGSVVTNTSVTMIDAITNAQTGATMHNNSDVFICQLDLTAVVRLRVIFVHVGAVGADCDVKGLLVTGDSIG